MLAMHAVGPWQAFCSMSDEKMAGKHGAAHPPDMPLHFNRLVIVVVASLVLLQNCWMGRVSMHVSFVCRMRTPETRGEARRLPQVPHRYSAERIQALTFVYDRTTTR
jgi:hypothetical protein